MCNRVVFAKLSLPSNGIGQETTLEIFFRLKAIISFFPFFLFHKGQRMSREFNRKYQTIDWMIVKIHNCSAYCVTLLFVREAITYFHYQLINYPQRYLLPMPMRWKRVFCIALFTNENRLHTIRTEIKKTYQASIVWYIFFISAHEGIWLHANR